MKTTGYIHDGWFVLRLGAEIDADNCWVENAQPNPTYGEITIG